MTANLPVLGESTKSSLVVAELERRILSGELPPGERLPTESELCEALAVSRSVIRDAIRTLAARGLVDVRQGRGMTVAKPDTNAFGHALMVLLSRAGLTMGEVVDGRGELESSLVGSAALRGGPEDWGLLEASLEKFSQAVDASGWEEARQSHLQFHLGIFRALHLPALDVFLLPMAEIIVVSAAPPRLEAEEDWEVATHYPILESLRKGDPAAAGKAMREHFRATMGEKRYGEFRSRPFGQVFTELPWATP